MPRTPAYLPPLVGGAIHTPQPFAQDKTAPNGRKKAGIEQRVEHDLWYINTLDAASGYG